MLTFAVPTHQVRAALRQEVEQVREERRFDLEETKNELVKEMLTAEDEHAVEMESLKTHVEGQLHALRADHDTGARSWPRETREKRRGSIVYTQPTDTTRFRLP